MRRLLLCLAEVRELRAAAADMHAALLGGDTAEVRRMADVQELHIWRIGRLLQAPAGTRFEGEEAVDVEGAVPNDVENALRQEMFALAEAARVNARLLEDGIRTSRALLELLVGAGSPTWRAWGVQRPGAAVFSGRA